MAGADQYAIRVFADAPDNIPLALEMVFCFCPPLIIWWASLASVRVAAELGVVAFGGEGGFMSSFLDVVTEQCVNSEQNTYLKK